MLILHMSLLDENEHIEWNGSLLSFLRDNRDGIDWREIVQTIRNGEIPRIGGGAAPLFEIWVAN